MMIGGFVGGIVLLAVGMALLIPLAIVWVFIEVIRALFGGGRRGWANDRYDPAAEALRYRYASGQISQAEFEAGMHDLGYRRVR